MHANLSFVAYVLSLFVVAIPLCFVAIGMTRFFNNARSSARSLSMLKEKPATPSARKLSNADAARARANARSQAKHAISA